MKPLVFDLFCGLGGWSEAFIAQGWRAVGFDIEKHDYGTGGYPGELIVRDVRSLSGSELVKEYGVPACVVASPPCQEFSYMAMPWSKAKEKMRKIQADPAEQKRLTDLFNQCFRIQREVSEAAGHYVPIVIENVRGAQKWVGKARWNFGSYYLWGDVPALMPFERKFKSHGMNWCDQTKKGQDFTRVAGQQSMEGIKVPSYGGRRTDKGTGVRFTSRCRHEGTKGFGDFNDCEAATRWSSKSKQRKQWAAEIAKIPPALAEWIAKCFKPVKETA